MLSEETTEGVLAGALEKATLLSEDSRDRILIYVSNAILIEQENITEEMPHFVELLISEGVPAKIAATIAEAIIALRSEIG